MDPAQLPEDIQAKFEKLGSPLDFHAKSELLTWFVDSMSSEVLNHFETSGLYNEMTEPARLQLIEQVEALQTRCRSALFDLHKSNTNGTLVQDTEFLTAMKEDIQQLRERVDLIKIEKSHLSMIKDHNSNVDQFTKTFPERSELIDELNKLEVFQTEQNSYTPSV